MAWKRNNPGCPCCAKCKDPGTLCVTVTTGCSPPNNLVAASVTLLTKDAEPETVATCTTTGQLTSITRTAAGSGYTNGTGYALGISGGGSGGTGTFDVVGGQVTNIKITAGGSYTSVPSITFPGAGGSGATATAALTSKCCVDGIPAGTYTLSVGIPGSTKTQDVTIQCKKTTDATTSFASPSPGVGTITVSYVDCEHTYEGTPVTITSGSTTVASGAINSDGLFSTQVAAGPYTISLTNPASGVTFTRSVTVLSCSGTGWILTTQRSYCITGRANRDAAGCVGVFNLYNGFTGTLIGTNNFTLVDDGTESVFDCCVDFTEVTTSTYSSITVEIVFPGFTQSNPTGFACFPSFAPEGGYDFSSPPFPNPC